MRWGSAYALFACVACSISGPALAQNTTGGGTPPAAATPAPDNKLPPVEVIQKQAQPAPKAIQQQAPPKKKIVQPAPQPAPAPQQPAAVAVPGTGGLDTGTVQMSPVQGSSIPISKYPGAVGRASASDIDRAKLPSAPELLQQTVPSALISDAQGNIYQRDLQYRGFEASPVNGVAQGIAVYQNGVRINESFGDIVNWDFLPDNAIEGITIVGANPVFGLNAIGGAATIVMRDGFNFQGVEVDSRYGSFGHIQGSVAAGARSGNWGAFIAGEDIKDDGFRDFSEAKIRRMYADLGVKGDGNEFHLNFTGADNFVGVTAAAPVQLLDLGWSRTFTSPQTTENKMAMVSANGSVKATPSLTFSGVGYYRWFQQQHQDGNIAQAVECAAPGGGTLCWDDNDPATKQVRDQNGNIIPVAGGQVGGHDIGQLGSIDKTSQDANSWGGSVQGVDKTPIAGMPNQFLLGTSYDHGNVAYNTSSELGFFGPLFVVNPFGITMSAPSDVRPRKIDTTNDYVGVYVSDTLDLTRKLSLTLGGRYNYARLGLQNLDPDPAFPDLLTGTHTYERFNPMGGLTYKIAPGLSIYGSYAEANRAPTAAELACADPVNPCLIESFLTADPPLKQVVSHTYEAGLRGKFATFNNENVLEWTAGAFRTENDDDIIAVASTINGRGYFTNAGTTLRQGIELGAQYHDRRLMLYTNYAYIDATFQTQNVLSSPDNPSGFECIPGNADAGKCINVTPGSRLPGVPRHRFKVGFDYWLTPEWKFGSDLITVSDQVFFGDQANLNEPLAGYTVVNIHSSYDITKNIQIYSLVNNVFDTHYGLFGNYFNLAAANNAASADPSTGAGFFTNPRTITPGAPLAVYGGLKLRF
jgi:iron complex outermembrane recepter protein